MFFFSAARALQEAGPNKCGVIVGKMADAESMTAIKDLVNSLGSEMLATEKSFPSEGAGIDLRTNYLLNNKIANLEEADAVVLIGTNPRYEAPLINTRLRKGYLHNEQNIALIGPQVDLTYDYEVSYLSFWQNLVLKMYSPQSLEFLQKKIKQ